MGNLSFAQNVQHMPSDALVVNNGSLSVFGFNLYESISLITLNFGITYSSSANRTHTLSVGLYTLTGSALSLFNSASLSHSSANSFRGYWSITGTSATSNLTPGTYFFGLLFSTGGASMLNLVAGTGMVGTNAWPGGVIGGALSVSTGALPASIATSDLTTANAGDLAQPLILLTS